MGRLPSILVAVSIFSFLAPTKAIGAAEEYLEIIDMPSLSVDDKGRVILSITVRNTHPNLTMWLAGADLTLKQDGLVFGYLPISCKDDIGPGQTAECSKDTGLSGSVSV